MEQARRQTRFRVLVALALLWGCAEFAVGVSWLQSAMAWARDDRAVQWQQYTMSAILLSFVFLVLLGTWKPWLGSRILLLVAALTVAQGIGLAASTADGPGPGFVLLACIILVGGPALLTAWLFAWRSRPGSEPSDAPIDARRQTERRMRKGGDSLD